MSTETTANPAIEAAAPVRRSYLWLIFVAVFALQLAVWAAWLVVASRHPVAEVPLTTAPRR